MKTVLTVVGTIAVVASAATLVLAAAMHLSFVEELITGSGVK